MPNKRANYEIAGFKADTRDDHLGEFEALVSVFDNVDLMGDRVVKGAFKNSLAAYEESGDPIPVYWSHDWGRPQSNLGAVTSAHESDKGLVVHAKLDIHDNPDAAYVFKLLQQRRVKEFSFAYKINAEQKGKDGANELTDLDILEVGPCFKGANPETELLATKDSTSTYISPVTYSSNLGAVWTLNSPGGTPVISVTDTKAGARLSAATKSEMQAIHDGMNELTSRMRTLMGTASEEPPKTDEPRADDARADTHSADEEPPTAKSNEPEDSNVVHLPEPQPAAALDGDLLAIHLRIAEMRKP